MGDYWDKWWNGKENPDSVKPYVDEIFKKNIFSEEKLNSDLKTVVEQFKFDLEASRNQLFSEIKLALKISGSPIKLDEQQLKVFTSDIEMRASKLSQEMGRDGAVIGVLPFVASTVAGMVAEKVVQAVIVSVGSSMAVEAAAGGGAVVVSAGTGEEVGGKVGGTYGRVVGIGIGLVVGLVAEHLATKELQGKLTQQCTDFITSVETSIVSGNNNSQGLKAIFNDALNITEKSHRDTIIAALNGGGE
jgi:hypothetical protein